MAEFDLVQPKHKDFYEFISPSGGLADASQNKSVLVVGAGSGIGKAIASAFAATGASNIVITSRRAANLEDVKKEITAAFPKANVLAIPADAATPDGVDHLFSQIAAANITLDVLVNSQGITRSKTSIRNSDPGDWWADWEVMVRSPYLTTRGFLRSLPVPTEKLAQPTRAIVNLSSLGSNLLLPGHTSYGAPKAALNRITEYTAAEATLLGVQAVGYHPGGIADTGITSKSPEHMKRMYTETAELAAFTAVYLSSPGASYLTGRYVDARWDLGELENHKERIVKEDLLKTAILGHERLNLGPQIREMVEKL
jgi:NAD(P)-dependent dehydrogenase (short-subunit alcohol dehydrogenase family)